MREMWKNLSRDGYKQRTSERIHYGRSEMVLCLDSRLPGTSDPEREKKTSLGTGFLSLSLDL